MNPRPPHPTPFVFPAPTPFVFPAKAGIHPDNERPWVPASAGKRKSGQVAQAP